MKKPSIRFLFFDEKKEEKAVFLFTNVLLGFIALRMLVLVPFSCFFQRVNNNNYIPCVFFFVEITIIVSRFYLSLSTLIVSLLFLSLLTFRLFCSVGCNGFTFTESGTSFAVLAALLLFIFFSSRTSFFLCVRICTFIKKKKRRRKNQFAQMWWRTLSRTRFGGATSRVVRRRAAALRVSCRSDDTLLRTSARSFATLVTRSPAVQPQRAVAFSPVLLAPRRAQSSLQRLLEDRNDPYLAAIQDFDIPRIAAIVEEGPTSTAAVPEAFLQRLGLRTDNGVTAAARAQRAAPTSLTQRAATSSAEAVLQSLHAAGVERQHEAEATAAAELKSAQVAYDALSAEEKTALQLERVVSHLFDGVCAISAAIRVQAEDGAVSPEERDAVYRVCERVAEACDKGTISADRWAADFAAEMEELAAVWRHLGDPRPLPTKKDRSQAVEGRHETCM